MKPRLGLFAWIVSALVLIGAIYAATAILNFVWWGPGYAGALAPQEMSAASRAHVYDHVVVVEPKRVIFRRSTWAHVRFATLLGAAAAIVALLVRKRGGRVVLLVWVGVAFATFVVVRSRARDVVVPRGPGREVLLRAAEDEYLLVDKKTATVLLRLPGAKDEDARFWRDVIAEKIASR